MTQFARLASLGLICLGLTACGGGGGTASAGSTPPSPAPTEPAKNSNLTATQVSESYANRGAKLGFTAVKGTGQVDGRPAGGGTSLTVAYDAAAQSYTITGDGQSQTFRPADIDSAASGAAVAFYARSAAGTTDSLALFKPGAANPTIALTYVSYGAWQRTVEQGTTIAATQRFFVYGVPTAASAMPTSGTASYATTLDGFMANDTGLYSLTGASSFTADFSAGTVNVSLAPVGTEISTHAVRSFGTLTGNGTLTAASSSFASDLAGSGYSGSINGQFFGPGAAEMGGVFTFGNATGAATGVIVGKKN